MEVAILTGIEVYSRGEECVIDLKVLLNRFVKLSCLWSEYW